MLKLTMAALALSIMSTPPVIAEEATYGSIYLGGLARDVEWPYNDRGLSYVMVCNVNGPDGFLSVRMGPTTDQPEMRSFNRLAILEVDTREWQGDWVRVVDAMRTHTVDGVSQAPKALPVVGWAHSDYLCSFQD